MSKTVRKQEELVEIMKKVGNRQLFLAQSKDNKLCYFLINDDELNDNLQMQCYMRDFHDNSLNITAFVFAIKLMDKVYISFVDFKNKSQVKIIKDIISQDGIKVRVMNEHDDYFIHFQNPSKEDFKKLFNEVSTAVKAENYRKSDFDNFTINICNTYSNEELWNIWKEELDKEAV